MKTKFLISIALLFAFVFVGCQGPQEESIGSCIKPQFTYAFPTYATAFPNAKDAVKRVLPSGNWQIATTMPTMPNGHYPLMRVGVDNALWLVSSSGTGNNEEGFVYRYQPNTNEWSTYSSIDGISVIPEIVLVNKDGTIWGIGLRPQKYDFDSDESAVLDTLSILSRYDDVNDQFRFVHDQSGFLTTLHEWPISSSRVGHDKQGVLWMVLGGEQGKDLGLYSYNPNTGELKHHLSELSLTTSVSLAVAPNDDIWLLDHDIGLIQYEPSTGALRNPYGVGVENWRGDLYFDRVGNLWSGYDGWLDLTSTPMTWNAIIPSPLFITDYFSGDNQFVWTEADVFQSSNGWYWFSGGSGVIRLITETGEWCKFTTEFSRVVEDNNRNLWIAVDDQLYRYRLPQED